jgi:hypothetical protein
MGSITIDLIVERVVNSNVVVAMVIYGVCKQLKPQAMSRPVVSTGMLP